MSITKCLEFALLAASLTGNAAGKVGKVGFGATEKVSQGINYVSLKVSNGSKYVEKNTRAFGEDCGNLEKNSQAGIKTSEKMIEEGKYLQGYALLAAASAGDTVGKVGKLGFGVTELASQGLKNATSGLNKLTRWTGKLSTQARENSEFLEEKSQKLGANAEEKAEEIVQEWVDYSEELLEQIREYQLNAYKTILNFLPRMSISSCNQKSKLD